MVLDSNYVGYVAVTKVIEDLSTKGFNVFLPIAEYGPIDLVAEKDGKCFRVQVKSSVNGSIRQKRLRHNKTFVSYDKDDFDFYAIYLSTIAQVVYAPIEFGGSTISFQNKKASRQTWWYEDFLLPPTESQTYEKRNIVGYCDPHRDRPNIRKTEWPTKDELFKLVWEIPSTQIGKKYGVSDRTIGVWCRKYGIIKPPRGYWRKLRSIRSKN